ncbi:MAG: hypothetical protein BWY01_01525 [Synergistetes bacterium ADurb.Bin155]|nr:MAG: hypothetical protein BWY01_01525 [Synergistetes bacterium ADurb.Bin155]
MPRYKNETASAIQWNGISWAPGFEGDALIFCPPDVELTKVSDSPAVPAVILAAQTETLAAGGSKVLDLPYPASGMLWISLIAVSGAGTLALGDGAAAIPIDGATGWSGEIEWTRVAKITLASASGCTMRLIVEEVG